MNLVKIDNIKNLIVFMSHHQNLSAVKITHVALDTFRLKDEGRSNSSTSRLERWYVDNLLRMKSEKVKLWFSKNFFQVALARHGRKMAERPEQWDKLWRTGQEMYLI